MRTALTIIFATAALASADEPKLLDAPKPPDGFPRFKVQEVDTGLKIGYAVITTDVDGDAKPDIVVVDQHQVVWYQNPTWKKRVILDGKTKPDNVCVTALDIDGDKRPELVLGAAWKPFDTKNPGTLQWLKRGKSLDDEWTMHPIPCDEPTVHRVQAIDVDGDGKPEVVMAPLMGRDATKEKNWVDGRPVKILAYKVPTKDPEKAESWKPEVLSDSLFVCHNFTAVQAGGLKGAKLFAVSYAGLHAVSRGEKGGWVTTRIGEGDQSNPKGSSGASEVAGGGVEFIPLPRATDPEVKLFDYYVATVEPWHGNSVVVYENPADVKGSGLWKRSVIGDQLRWGHAVRFAHLGVTLEGERWKRDTLIVGVRDNPTKDDKFTEKRGVRLYRFDAKGKKWERYILEDGGVAVEDLTVADLNADGKPDIVAVGRATGNARIYWNQGK